MRIPLLEAVSPLLSIVNRLERVAYQAKSICDETLLHVHGRVR